jgi:hypothetical protein
MGRGGTAIKAIVGKARAVSPRAAHRRPCPVGILVRERVPTPFALARRVSVPAKSKPRTWLLIWRQLWERARRGKLLGHMQVQTTARYAHLAADPVKDPADPGSGEYRASINQAT